MDAASPDKMALFVGDLDDPWVMEIVEAISRIVVVNTIMADDAFPVRIWEDDEAPPLVILHRSRLSSSDLARIAGWRQTSSSNHLPPIILCYSPYMRNGTLERCSQVVDRMVPEATAIDILPRHILHFLDETRVTQSVRMRGRLPVEARSNDHELRSTLVEACSAAGFSASESPEPSLETDVRTELAQFPKIPPRVTLWDVPVLESGWPQAMKRLSWSGPVIALMGFADRANVALARASGAAACLELPFDLDDLAFVLDRIGQELANDRSLSKQEAARAESPHLLPPPPASRTSRGRRAIRERGFMMPLWSDEEAPPRIDPDLTAE
jgi:hypothetical protein